MHGTPFRRWLSRQFSIAYDLYLDIRRGVDSLVQTALKRDTPDWRLRNACPACTFKLKDEPRLKFDMLFTMDGNDSLKRVIRRGAAAEDKPGSIVETLDHRILETDYYISRRDVDKWAGRTTQDSLPLQNTEDDSQPNKCEDRWRNMSPENTKRMWGVFDETGIFLALCRHGFTLVLADMVQSGRSTHSPLLRNFCKLSARILAEDMTLVVSLLKP